MGTIFLVESERAKRTHCCSLIEILLYVIVINRLRGLYVIHEGEARVARVYESRTNRASVHNYFIARKYCVLSRYVANNYINVFPANTVFNDAYQTISDIQFIATGRVAPVTGYKYIVYSVTKILRKIRATTFTENYGK